MANVENLQMGPCSVFFKGVDLGLTKGGVEVEFGTEVNQITADQFGETAVDEVINGRSIVVRVPLAESDLSKLLTVIPGSTLVGTTTKKLVVKASAGTSLRSLAGVLVCHPYERDASDKEFDLLVYEAMAKGDFSFAYRSGDQRVYNLEFSGYVNLDTGNLFEMGDPAAAGGVSLIGAIADRAGQVDVPVNFNVASHFAGATSYAATGLPTGLSINAASGLISGTPSTATGSPFTVKITASNGGASITDTFTWVINA